MQPCPPQSVLEELIDGSLAEADAAQIEDHVSNCATCGSWLEQTTGDEDLLASVRTALQGTASDTLPANVAGFRILAKLGAGGMGIVYEAEQDRPRRRVALKVIRAGAASARTLRRFEQEAQVLGLLRHPGIAQIYEAGTFDSPSGAQPFFAMELCEGRPLLDYLREFQPSLRDRLMLLVRICDAVDHAHRMGVIHRDLKPGNILVDDRQRPKILDFGVARFADRELDANTLQTLEGQLIGTLPYMSPEQLSGDPTAVDIRSDVYSLGVVCYEMLTGQRPHDLNGKSAPEALRILSEDDPTTLSATNRALRGDVETIVNKALEKDVDRRYESAATLANEVQRYLDDEPIAARPPSTAYQLRKFARRNRAFVGGVVAVFVVLIAGIVTAMVLRRDALAAAKTAEEEKRAAQREVEEAEATREFFQETLVQASPIERSGGAEPTISQVLEKALSMIDDAPSPHVEAAVRHTLGRVQSGFGKYDESVRHFRRSLELYQQVYGAEHEKVAQVLGHLAGALYRQGNYEEAKSRAKLVVAMDAVLTDKHPITLAVAHRWVGECHYLDGEFDDAEREFRAALAAFASAEGDDGVNVAVTKDSLARLMSRRGRIDEAEELFRESLAIHEARMPRSPTVATVMGNLSGLLRDRGKLDDAEKMQRESLAIKKECFGEEHQQVAVELRSLGIILCQKRETAKGLETLEEAVAMLKKTFGPEHARVAWGLESLAKESYFAGRLEDSENHGREAIRIASKALGPNHIITLRAMLNLGATLGKRGRMTDAHAMLEQCYAATKEHGAWDEDLLAQQRRALVGVLSNLKKADRVRDVLEEQIEAGPAGSPSDAWARRQLAALHFRTSRPKLGRDVLGDLVLGLVLESAGDRVYVRSGGKGTEILLLHSGGRADKSWLEVEQSLRRSGLRVTYVELSESATERAGAILTAALDGVAIDAVTVVAHGTFPSIAEELHRSQATRFTKVVSVEGAVGDELAKRIVDLVGAL